MRRLSLAAALLAGTALLSPGLAQTAQQSNDQSTLTDHVDNAVAAVTGDPLANADTDMKHVLDALAAMDPKPIETLSPVEARQQPTPADGAAQVLREQGNSTLPDASVGTKAILVSGGAGTIPATVYTPPGAGGAKLPVIVYFHGGGFVIATNATYDATPRMLAKQVNAIVVSVEYRKAPEYKFPAAHDDAIAAYTWVTQNAASLGGDPARIAVAGESAGGNLATNVAIAARDRKLPLPVHELIVYPMAGTNLDTASYQENASAKPLNKAMMGWFYRNLTSGPGNLQDPRLDIVDKADLHGLAPATVILAQIDPLRSDGEGLVAKLKAAGVEVDAKTYPGVTHEFFGMGLVVGKARDAEQAAVADLKAAFASPPAPGAAGPAMKAVVPAQP